MKKAAILYIAIFILTASFSFSGSNGYVPDKETAIKIAEAVWLPIYGKSIDSKKPFIAALLGDTVWHVHGSLSTSHFTIDKNGDTTFIIVRGGVPHIFLQKTDGKILDVYHDK